MTQMSTYVGITIFHWDLPGLCKSNKSKGRRASQIQIQFVRDSKPQFIKESLFSQRGHLSP